MPYDGVSAILNDKSQAGIDSFKAAVKPTLLRNGLETAIWSAACDGGKLTLHASSFSDLTRRLTFENSSELNPYLLALANPVFFVDDGHKLVLQGGNLIFEDNKITGSATRGGPPPPRSSRGTGPYSRCCSR